ncbi:ribonuclease H-like domain-containing protein [Cristinia sonorae]|uniref:Ribonuclease n=1 Tax=Cristinia sonorae TaxID=1940300 RepID=A0A8K0UMF3_9AGAR|nr:ribonuclease H-like domain-containing protein [Cristinia sonorae]
MEKVVEEETPEPEEIIPVPSIVNPGSPLLESYTYHSPLPTAPGPYILGVDEAGRGPVLGPMVYGVAYCPVAYKDDLNQLGFADSKTLTPEVRSSLLKTLSSDPDNLGWSVRVLCPQAISAGMLRRPPMNLNQQSQAATVHLIQEVLKSGIQLTEVYVDALGNTTTYEAYLSKLFPGIDFTVTQKADSKFKIVGAASVAAKVTRDAWIEGWIFEENNGFSDTEAKTGNCWGEELGSGYPSDPKTKAWVKGSLDPTFGFPSLVRFSWTTIKVELEKDGHPVEWIDEGQKGLIKAFATETGRDQRRCAVVKDLGIRSVGML